MTYTAIRSSAADLISRKGQTVTIAGTTGGTYDVSQGSVSGSAYSKTAKAVMLPMSPYRQSQGSNIRSGDEQMLLAGLDTSGAALAEPPLNAVVTLADGSTKYTLISVDPIHPDCAMSHSPPVNPHGSSAATGP